MRKIRVVQIVSAVLLVVVGVTLTAFGQGDEPVVEAAPLSRDETHLTVYQSGFALVRDVRTFQLEVGLNRVQFSGVPDLIEQETVSFVSDQPGSYVVEQRFTPATLPPNLDMMILGNVGQQISVVLEDEESTSYTGILLNADYDLVIQLADGSIVTLERAQIRQYTLSSAGPQAVAPPALTLLVRSQQAGPQQLTLLYITGGLSWQDASYNLRLAADNETVNFSGWITLYNGTGVPFESARVTLGAGDFDRLQYVAHQAEFAAMPTATLLPTPTAIPATGGGGAVQPANLLLDLPRPVTLAAYESLLVDFLAGAETPAQNVYVYDASPRVFGYSGFITVPDYGLTDITVVQNYLGFSTRTVEEGGLGTALPAGSMRIYQENESGASVLIGQTQLAFTREGENVRLLLENSADLTGARIRTDFQVLSTDAIQETFEIRLTNSGDRDLTVIVPERMTRSARWEILGATAPYEQPDPFGIQFTVDVPAGGESVITYTVLYTTPQ